MGSKVNQPWSADKFTIQLFILIGETVIQLFIVVLLIIVAKTLVILQILLLLYAGVDTAIKTAETIVWTVHIRHPSAPAVGSGIAALCLCPLLHIWTLVTSRSDLSSLSRRRHFTGVNTAIKTTQACTRTVNISLKKRKCDEETKAES